MGRKYDIPPQEVPTLRGVTYLSDSEVTRDLASRDIDGFEALQLWAKIDLYHRYQKQQAAHPFRRKRTKPRHDKYLNTPGYTMTQKENKTT